MEKQVWRLQRWSNQEEGKKVEEKVFKNDREEAVMVGVLESGSREEGKRPG